MKVLITGGCGFIGVNAAKRYLDKGGSVVVLDDLSRKGSDINLAWLKSQKGDLTFQKADICDFKQLNKIMEKHRDSDLVLHFAAQVAVTTSVTEPRRDFEINALGTFNLLEALRLNDYGALLIFSSTNKVYGGIENARVTEKNNKYCYENLPEGIDEGFNLDFHSPYGCSKGAADQYVRDYNRIYGLKTVVFRQSCIYGINQFGVEDQGWVAHFTIQSILDRPMTIYGDGKQVRDVLYVSDLIDAYDTAYEKREICTGQIYNIGGGKDNQLSLLELVNKLEGLLDKKIKLGFSDWRPGDQRIFVSNNRKFQDATGWKTQFDVNQGLKELIRWAQKNQDTFRKLF
jgi:CDP-paratose 2-epimerase